MNGKSVLAAALVACTAVACVTSLWNRDDAVWILALSSLPTLWYIFPPMAKAIIYTVGYPWYLILFLLTFLVPGGGDSLADS